MPDLDNNTIISGLSVLRQRLPQGWDVVSSRATGGGRDEGYDATAEFRGPGGTSAVLAIWAKKRLNAQQAANIGPRLLAAASRIGADGAMLVAPFLSKMTRDRLNRQGLSYLDLTGNARISLERPALLIETQGAATDPNPPSSGIRSLKGAKAARVVRALCDWQPPVGVRVLAARGGADPGYTTRVLSFLAGEDVIARGLRGRVEVVNWQDLLRRWAQDYQVTRTNRIVPCLAARGLDALMDRLRSFRSRYAVTGSYAVPPAASVAPSRLVSCYVDNAEQAVAELDLRIADRGANVLLIEPFDSVVFERPRDEEEVTRVALSQCVADLLTGTGREPAEAESVMSWMATHQAAWRLPPTADPVEEQ